jgi:hypothetical protein
LLRREAIQVQARIQQVKSKVSEYELGNQHGKLATVLRNALSPASSPS